MLETDGWVEADMLVAGQLQQRIFVTFQNKQKEKYGHVMLLNKCMQIHKKIFQSETAMPS